MRGPGLGLAIALCGVAAAASLWLFPPEVVPTGDEPDYFRAAVHLARSGVLSCAPLSLAVPPRDAYREPGYPFLLAAYWRLARVPVPEETPPSWTHVPSAASGAIAVLGALLLGTAAAGASLAARLAGASGRASLAAAVFVLASPALRQAALVPGSEGLAAALMTLAACGLAAAVTRGARGDSGTSGSSASFGATRALMLAGLASGICPLVRGAGIVIVPAGMLVLLLVPGSVSPRRRVTRAALFACFALLPVVAWMVRNSRATGHFVLADRGGAVLSTRAELDRQIAKEGVLPAMLAFTPLESARRAGERWWPEATYSRYQWTGEGNFFTRSMRSWKAARQASVDPLAVDRALGRKALGQFLARPGEHILAGFAVAWRGIFAERSPELMAPFDLTFVLGLLLAGAAAAVVFLAIRTGRVMALVLLAGPIALFCAHAAATEFLPRFSVPGLPLLGAAAVAAISQARSTRDRRAGPGRDEGLPADRGCDRAIER